MSESGVVIPLCGQVTGSTQVLFSCVFSWSNPNQVVNPEWDYSAAANAAKISCRARAGSGDGCLDVHWGKPELWRLCRIFLWRSGGRSLVKTNDVLAAAGLTGEEHMDIPGQGRALRDVSTAAADQQNVAWITWGCSGTTELLQCSESPKVPRIPGMGWWTPMSPLGQFSEQSIHVIPGCL